MKKYIITGALLGLFSFLSFVLFMVFLDSGSSSMQLPSKATDPAIQVAKEELLGHIWWLFYLAITFVIQIILIRKDEVNKDKGFMIFLYWLFFIGGLIVSVIGTSILAMRNFHPD